MGTHGDTSLRLTLGVLLTVYVFNFLDRQVINILAEPIGRELALSDTQIGLMTGLAFALFYTIVGLPIASYADRPRTNRVRLIAIAITVWSLFTVLCGLAQNFVQMLLARIGVGVGEAGGTPPAHSLITDLVPAEKRGTAMSVYQMGPAIGGLVGMALGGLLADTYGWRVAFIAVGVPGVLIAGLLMATLRDPRHTAAGHPAAEWNTTPAPMPMAAALRHMWQSRALRLMLLVSALASFGGYGILLWATIFFQRSHGMTPSEVGLSFGIINGLAMMAGTYLGGYLSDRFGAVEKKHTQTVPALGLMLAPPCYATAFLAPTSTMSLLLFIPPTVLSYLYFGPVFSAGQGLVAPQARALTSAMMVFLQNLVGLGLGPLVLGIMSDRLKPEYGDDSVRYVLLFATLFSLFAGIALWISRRYLNEELDRPVPIQP